MRPSPYSISNVGGDKPREASWMPSNKNGASVTADKPRQVVTRVGVLGHPSGGPIAPPGGGDSPEQPDSPHGSCGCSIERRGLSSC